MLSSQSDNSSSQPIATNVQEESHFEDEINLADYLRIIWKRKYFILLGSVLPASIVSLILFFSPRKYKVIYTYDVRELRHHDVQALISYDDKDLSSYNVIDRSNIDVSNWNFNERNYTVLLDIFYSGENLYKIINKLRESNLDEHAKIISRATKKEDLKKFVYFEVLPPFIDSSKAKITSAAELEQIRRLKAQLLKMTIIGRPKNDISKISSVIRDNLENVTPVYFIKEQLNVATRGCRNQMADIEKNMFSLELSLKTNESILVKLKDMKASPSTQPEGRISVQFDIGDRSEYLPVEYQIQATKSKAIQLEEQISSDKKKYSYYEDLRSLNERLLAELNNKTSSYYTIHQFHSFLMGLVNSYKNNEIKDYLNSYIKRIENRISASLPITEDPKLSAVSKDIAKKSVIVFTAMLILSALGALLIEDLHKGQNEASQKQD
ncbi:MAG: hypothetical protein ACYS8Y_02730 [Planctomycetota bacterium]|jgi:hypothetical protein